MIENADYWKKRCMVLEHYQDQLEKEIFKLRGYIPLTAEQISEHNRKVKDMEAKPK